MGGVMCYPRLMSYNPASGRRKNVPGHHMRESEIIAGAQPTIAIITAETSAFPDMQHFLAPRFQAGLAQDEKQIQAAVDDQNVRAILLDLDNVGEASTDALQLLQEIR